MKRIIFFAIVLIVAVLIGVQIKSNPGYILISTHHYAIETRLWFAIVSILISFIVLYYLIRFLKLTLSAPKHWRAWRKHEKHDKAIVNAYKGCLALLNGQWGKAQKQLLSDPKQAPLPALNYLAAAVAAQRNGEDSKSAKYLRSAALSAPKEEVAIGLVKAQLQYNAADYQQALQTLSQLGEFALHNTWILTLLAKIQKKRGDWEALVTLFEPLRQQQALPTAQIHSMAIQAYQHLFSTETDPIALKHLWKAMDKNLQPLPTLSILYVAALNRLNEVELAEKLARNTLKQQWLPELARLYGAIETDHPKKQLVHAEQWLQAQPKDANLLYTCARLAQRLQVWDKAKDYYRASLQAQINAEVAGAFAQLLEQQGDIKQSLTYYQLATKSIA